MLIRDKKWNLLIPWRKTGQSEGRYEGKIKLWFRLLGCMK